MFVKTQEKVRQRDTEGPTTFLLLALIQALADSPRGGAFSPGSGFQFHRMEPIYVSVSVCV